MSIPSQLKPSAAETNTHLFFFCPQVTQIWNKLGFPGFGSSEQTIDQVRVIWRNFFATPGDYIQR